MINWIPWLRSCLAFRASNGKFLTDLLSGPAWIFMSGPYHVLQSRRRLSNQLAQAQGLSSVGRASVSKTEGRGFESLSPCQTLPCFQTLYRCRANVASFRALGGQHNLQRRRTAKVPGSYLAVVSVSTFGGTSLRTLGCFVSESSELSALF